MGKVAQMMTPSTLKEERTIFENRGVNNLTIEGRGIVKNKIQLGFAGIIKGKKNTPIIWNTTLRGVPRREPPRRGQDGQAM